MTAIHWVLAAFNVACGIAAFAGFHSRLGTGMTWMSVALIFACFAMGAKVVWP